MPNDYIKQWISYENMNILQKINLKANAVAAQLKYNSSPLDTPLMWLAQSDFRHEPDSYKTPFRFTKYK